MGDLISILGNIDTVAGNVNRIIVFVKGGELANILNEVGTGHTKAAILALEFVDLTHFKT